MYLMYLPLPLSLAFTPCCCFVSCSGDSRVLCGTDTMVSIYSLDGTGPTPTPPTPTPPTSDEFELLGCSEDNVPDGNRVRREGKWSC